MFRPNLQKGKTVFHLIKLPVKLYRTLLNVLPQNLVANLQPMITRRIKLLTGQHYVIYVGIHSLKPQRVQLLSLFKNALLWSQESKWEHLHSCTILQKIRRSYVRRQASFGLKRKYDFLRLSFWRLSKETGFFFPNSMLTGHVIWWGPILIHDLRHYRNTDDK